MLRSPHDPSVFTIYPSSSLLTLLRFSDPQDYLLLSSVYPGLSYVFYPNPDLLTRPASLASTPCSSTSRLRPCAEYGLSYWYPALASE